MNNKKEIFVLYCFILLEFLILFNSKIVINSVIKSSSIFILNIFPGLFPTMTIGSILIKNNIEQIIPNTIKKIFNFLFNFDDNKTSLIITSIICGTPSNAMFINEYLSNDLINEKEAECLLCCTHFVNPLFIIGSVGIGIFNSFKTGIILLLMLYLSNFIKAFILRKNFVKTNKIKNKINTTSFINTLSSSITKSINNLFLIFGIIILFSILVTLITNIFNLNDALQILINGMLEMTGGIIGLNSLSINYSIKFLLAYYFLSFGGICIQMQAFSMITKKKIRYLKYLIFRLF